MQKSVIEQLASSTSDTNLSGLIRSALRMTDRGRLVRVYPGQVFSSYYDFIAMIPQTVSTVIPSQMFTHIKNRQAIYVDYNQSGKKHKIPRIADESNYNFPFTTGTIREIKEAHSVKKYKENLWYLANYYNKN